MKLPLPTYVQRSTTKGVVMSETTIITVTHNSAAVLETYWSNAELDGAEWIVVDNASSDSSASVAEKLGARVVKLKINLGFAAANNFGARLARGKVLVFCNPDVSVNGGVRTLGNFASLHGGIVAPQLTNPDGSLQENARGIPYPLRKISHRFGAPESDSFGYTHFAAPGEVLDIPWVTGAALAMTADDFWSIGGWDEGYFLYHEDSDLCFRMWLGGGRVRVLGDVRWIHGWARATGRGFSWDAWKHEIRSAIRFYRKHPYCVLPLGARGAATRRIDRSLNFRSMAEVAR